MPFKRKLLLIVFLALIVVLLWPKEEREPITIPGSLNQESQEQEQ
jgi:hypothetical protein